MHNHPTVRRASAKDYVTCRRVSIDTETDPRASAVFTDEGWRGAIGGAAVPRGRNAACTGGNQLWSFGALGKLPNSRSFGESRRWALAPNGKIGGDIEKQAAHQRLFGVRRASSSCFSAFPNRECVPNCMKRKTWSVEVSVRVGFAIQQHCGSGENSSPERTGQTISQRSNIDFTPPSIYI